MYVPLFYYILIVAARPRISFVSYRKFHSFAPVFQQHAVAEETILSDDTFGGSRQFAQHVPFERSDDRGRRREKYGGREFDTRKNRQTTRRGSMEGRQGRSRDPREDRDNADFGHDEAIQTNEIESQVKETEGYKPVHWLEYQGKIDEGFLESMKSIFKYRHLTEVQNTIVSQIPLEKDLLVRSKTGTGKTLGFLIPAIQRHLDHMAQNNLNPKIYAKTHTGILIIVPTRELAIQIANEARRLVHHVGKSPPKCQVLIGGDSKRLQIRQMDRERNDIIIGTPGRLMDYMETEEEVKEMMLYARTLILDEMDVLLDMGFHDDLTTIFEHLKEGQKDRLTMMFSATVDPKVQGIAKGIMRKDYAFINTVKSTDLDVHDIVKQTYIVHDMADHLKILLSLIITEQMRRPGGKIIVFFNSTKQVQLYVMMFRVLRRLYFDEHFQQFEIHSKMTQEKRSKVNYAFRSANVGSVLFTSDVS